MTGCKLLPSHLVIPSPEATTGRDIKTGRKPKNTVTLRGGLQVGRDAR